MDEEKRIRRLEDGDLEPAMALVWRVFSEFEAPEYSQEGIREFRDFTELASIREEIGKGMGLWGGYRGRELTGVLAVRRPAHVSLLFVDPAHHRQGIARGLYQAFLADWGVQEPVTVNSSPYAVEAYRRLGFEPVGEERVVNGIRFFPMRHDR